eukprot:GEZU01002182.1.p1 GENE.GEZU01002182.1~~GEZU01002182.1.p1  ORF type:complete len:235 (-),score=102.77 GEZU01002182.1:241-945(-)
MAKRETTEWEDALVRHGILPPAEVEITEEAIQDMVDEAARNYDPLAHKTLDELDELEDEEDERILEEYRQKRIAEMKNAALRNRYGSVMHISSSEFVDEVTNAPKDTWVVLHLYAGNPEDQIVEHCFGILAKKFRATKFLRIKGCDCIKGYPDRNCPTILVYYNGELKRQWVKLDPFAGKRTTPEDFEWALAKVGAVESDLEEDPRITKEDRFVVNVRRNNNRVGSSRDEDDDY